MHSNIRLKINNEMITLFLSSRKNLHLTTKVFKALWLFSKLAN